MNKLKQRWGITSNWQLAIIFVVFAINGSVSAKISAFLMGLLGLTKDNLHWFFYYIILLVLVMPLYPFLIMGFGFLFGQFDFFLA